MHALHESYRFACTIPRSPRSRCGALKGLTVLSFGMALDEGHVPRAWDAAERDIVQAHCSAKLRKDEIAQRDGGSAGKVSYIEAWRVIEKAQQIFGFDGWSSRIVDIAKEYEEQTSNSRWCTGYSAVIRVTLRDGTFHDDVGFGSVTNERDRGKAIENARKEAVSDGVKRVRLSRSLARVFKAARGQTPG